LNNEDSLVLQSRFLASIATQLSVTGAFTLDDIWRAIDELKKGATADEAMDMVNEIARLSDRTLSEQKENLELISELAIARKTIKALLKPIPE